MKKNTTFFTNNSPSKKLSEQSKILSPTRQQDPDLLKDVLFVGNNLKDVEVKTSQPLNKKEILTLEIGKDRRPSIRRLMSSRSCLNFNCAFAGKRPDSAYCYYFEEGHHPGMEEQHKNIESTPDSHRVSAAGNESTSTPTKDGFPTFLQRKMPPGIRRTKSSKLNQGKENRPMDMTSLMAQGSNLRNTEVELPFFMPAIESPDEIDLSNCASEFEGAVVRPLHHSILGRDHCFEVITENSTRCFACDSAGEREAWIEKIKRVINPNLDNSRRIEHQLILFVQEAKGLPTKKKYFCEICLDRKLCARTTSKWKNDSSIFWGEQFEFSSIPQVQDVTVHLYKDSDKKKKKDKDYIGLVNLPVSTLLNQRFVEKWFTLSTPSGNNKSKAGESMALRIRARFVSNRVLPTDQYKAFAEHISVHYLNICRTLGNVIPVSRKDEIARIMVNVMHGTGCIKNYMTDIVMDEVEKIEEESLIFRENTIGTKSVEAMLRLVGLKYLDDTLGDFIHAIFNMDEECEVDGSRLPPNGSLEINQKNLHMSCEIALCKIVSSMDTFPSELREVMGSWRIKCEETGRPRIANRLVTASVFLRLLCPAILNPSLFGLANEVPDAKVARTLTLIAKVIQNLANRSRFGIKEEYMQFMDIFVQTKWDDMGLYISNVSDPSIPPIHKGFKGFIDLGKEFAKLHTFFIEVLPTLDEKTVEELGELPAILNEVSAALEKPSTSNAPSVHSVSPEHHNLSQATEDVSLSHDSDHLLHSTSSPGLGSRNFLPTGEEATSLLDLRDFINASEDGDHPVASVTNDFSPHRHGSHPALPITCSFNNSNNSGISQNRQTLSSTENVITGATHSQQSPERPPLMFSNPAYRVSSRSQATHGSRSVSEAYLRSKQDPKKSTPLSFANPIQAMQPQQQQHRLETVFTTETVTYHSPSQFVTSTNSHRSGQAFKGFSSIECESCATGDVFLANTLTSDCSQSNESSLSSRQSSTSTASDYGDHSPNLGHLGSSRKNPYAIPQTSKSNTARPSNLPENRRESEDKLLMSVETVSTSISSAHRKTGLQQASQQSKSPEQSYRPQPKPRSSIANIRCDETSASRKTSVPNLPSARNPASNFAARRGSCGNSKLTKTTDDTITYPSFVLSKREHDIVLELNETTDAEVSDRKHLRRLGNPSQSTKDQDGFVTAPGAAVKSRVVVSTSNANRVKTSKHGTSSSSQSQQQKTNLNSPAAGQLRRSSQQTSASSTSKPITKSSSAALPATPESQMTPEARTAQWILNSVPTPNKELKQESEAVLTPKDYEDRILRLEGEVQTLREQLSETKEKQRSYERKESVLLEKIRNSERRELRSRKKLEDKDQEMQKITQRLKSLETAYQIESEEHARQKNQLQAIANRKEWTLAEQKKVIRHLEEKIYRSEHFTGTTSHESINVESSLSYIDDADVPEMTSRRAKKTSFKPEEQSQSSTVATPVSYISNQHHLNGKSSTSSSSSV